MGGYVEERRWRKNCKLRRNSSGYQGGKEVTFLVLVKVR
jgi:hypothetical protein